MKESEIIIKKSMKEFGISPKMKTDPKIIRSVIREMKLNNFKTNYIPIKKFFNEAKSKPQNLAPMFKNIQQGIISKHPAIVEFAKKALSKKWFKKSKHIVRSIHIAFILEALTAAMLNNNDFLTEVQEYILEKRRDYGINTTSTLSTFWRIFRNADSLFWALKTVSVDPAMTYCRTQKEFGGDNGKKMDAKKAYMDGKLTYLEYKIISKPPRADKKSSHDGLRLNIYEAGFTEYKKGFKENALCAHVLSEDINKNPAPQIIKLRSVLPENYSNSFYKSLINKNNLAVAVTFSQDWASLYEAWNLAFILGDLNDLDILFPKLLIPSVMDAESENYIVARTISLWLSTNTLVFRKLDKIKSVNGPKNKKEMSKVWGEINEKYARTFSEKHMRVRSKDLDKSFKKMFSNPSLSFIKLLTKV